MTTRAFSAAEINLLERWFVEHGRYRDRLFLVMAVATGYRVSELLVIRCHQLLTPGGHKH